MLYAHRLCDQTLIKLYLLLKDLYMQGKQYPSITLTEFCEKLELDPKVYTNYTKIRNKILCPAQHELALLTDITYSFCAIKNPKGRDVNAIGFILAIPIKMQLE